MKYSQCTMSATNKTGSVDRSRILVLLVALWSQLLQIVSISRVFPSRLLKTFFDDSKSAALMLLRTLRAAALFANVILLFHINFSLDQATCPSASFSVNTFLPQFESICYEEKRAHGWKKTKPNAVPAFQPCFLFDKSSFLVLLELRMYVNSASQTFSLVCLDESRDMLYIIVRLN